MLQNAGPGAVKAANPVGPTVRILCVTADLRAADFLEHELRSVAPTHRLEVVPRVDDALQRLEGGPAHDAVLIDADVPSDDAVRLITTIRGRSLPLAIVVLVGSTQKAPPLEALGAGADDYVVKRAHYTDRLHEILRQAIERQREEAERRLHPLQMFVVGDFAQIRQHLGNVPYLRLVEGTVGADGSLEGIPSTPAGHFPYDLVLIDDSITMSRALQALKDVRTRAPEIPAVLMIEPGDGDAAIQAHGLDAVEYLVKTGNHYERLAPLLGNIVHLRDLSKERRAWRSTEARLRTLIETVPASVTVIDRDGRFKALNRAGLPLLGADSPDQVVGRQLGSMVPPEQQVRVLSFLEGICAGGRGTIFLDCRGTDNVARRLELRAVPLRRDPDKTVAVLGVLRDASGDSVSGPSADLSPAVAAEASVVQTPGSEVPPSQEQQTAAAAGQAPAGRVQERELREDFEATTEALKAAQAQLAARDGECLRADQQAEQVRLEFEARQKTLEESLRAACERAADLEKQLEASRRELEQSRYDAEEKTAVLQGSLQSQLDYLARLDEERRLESEQQHRREQDLRQKCLSLEEALCAAELRSVAQSQGLRDRLDASERAESEARRQCADLQQSLVVRSSRIAELETELQLARDEAARSQRDREVERSYLQNALTAAESGLPERAQGEAPNTHELQRSLEEAVTRGAQLEQELQSARERLALLESELRAERDSGQRQLGAQQEFRAEPEQVRRPAAEQMNELGRASELARADLEAQLLRATQRASELEQELAGARGQLARAEAEIRAAREDMHRELAVRDADRAQLEESRRSAAAQLEDLRGARAQLEAGLMGTAQRSASLEHELTHTRERLTSVEAELLAERELAQHQLAAQQEYRAELEEAHRSAVAQLEALHRSGALLEAREQETSRRSAAIERELADARDRASRLEAELQAERERSQRELSRQRERQAGLEEAHRSALAQLEELTQAGASTRAELEARLQESERRCAQLEAQSAGLEESCRVAAERLEALAREHAAERSGLEAGLRETAERARRLEHELREAQARQEEVRREEPAAESLREALAEANRDREVLTTAYEEAVRNVAQLARAAAAAQEEQEDLRRMLGGIRGGQAAAEIRLTEAEQERLEEKAESGRLAARLSEESLQLRANIAVLEASLHEALDAQGVLKKQLEEMREAEERLQATRSELERSLTRSEQERLAASQHLWRERGEWAGTRKALEESQAEVERLKLLLADVSASLQRLLREQAERHQQAFSETVSKLQQEAEAKLQLQAFQHARESESLNRMLAEAGARHRQLEERTEAERRQAAASASRLRGGFERAIEASLVGLATTAENEDLVRCNAAFARLFGFADVRAALADPRAWISRFEGNREQMRELLRDAGSFNAAPAQILRPDGTRLHIVESAFVACDPDSANPLVEHCVVDVTDRLRLREELQRARRVQTLSSLCAAVDDALQDLAALSGSSQPGGDGPGEAGGKDGETAARVGGLLRQLLAACRRLGEPALPVDLNLALQETGELVRRLLEGEAELVFGSVPGLRSVSADRCDIDRLLVSVALDARNRLPSGGAVELHLANADFHHPLSGFEHGVQLRVNVVGYRALPPVKTDAIEEVVGRCGGLIRERDSGQGPAALEILLPGVE